MALAALCMLAGLVSTPAAEAATGQVDLRVLVISSGNRSEDAALELMAQLLDRTGVPYDILDSRRAGLAQASLYIDPQHGRYNGIILTVSDLFVPGGGSGFTLAEWQLLHAYERAFGVREAVISGYPTWDPSLDLDYGMGAVGSVASSAAQWRSPAGGTELFEYVNTANPLDVTDFAFTGQPRTDGTGPVVTPLLVNPGDNTVLISRLTYADGRQVLLSTIANAWYFLHSHILAYEFLDFATQGLFIGARQVHLSVHIDDLFIEDGLWDPAANTVSAASYRMTPADLTATVANQNQFRAAHPLAGSFLLQFAFNGYGAGNGTQIIPNETYTTGADAIIRSAAATTNYGSATSGDVGRLLGSESRFVVRFDNQLALGDPTITTATLRLNANSLGLGSRPARVCRLTEDWTEGTGGSGGTTAGNVSWSRRTGTTTWATAGASFDATTCVTFNLNYRGDTNVNITPIFQQWAAGQPDFGVVVMATTNSLFPVTLRTREATTGRPSLILTFPTTAVDPLTSAVVANRASFGFINHTYASRQMDRICPELPNPQPPLCPVTNLTTVTNEINRNRTVWQRLGLPNATEGAQYLLSDSHAGLHDRRSTEEDPADDIAYPQGLNPDFFRAMQNLGVRYVASDSSRPNQNIEATAPGYSVFVSPRYPTAIWTNSSTPAEDTDQYNWIFYDRFVAAGQNPCTSGGICAPRTWPQILAAEADLTTLHMISGTMWPHYMHQINLRAYSGNSQLVFDWLNSVMARYERSLKLPVLTLRPWEIGATQQRLATSRAQNVRGTLNLATNTVALVANGPAQPTVTGLAGGSLYGGQYQRVVSVGTTPVTLTVDPALGV